MAARIIALLSFLSKLLHALLQIPVLLLLVLLFDFFVLLVVFLLELLVVLLLSPQLLLQLLLPFRQLDQLAFLKLPHDRPLKALLRKLPLLLPRPDRRLLLYLRWHLLSVASGDTCESACAATAEVLLFVILVLVVEPRVWRKLHFELVHGRPPGADDAEVAVLVVDVEEVVFVLFEVGRAAASELVRQVEVERRVVLALVVLQLVFSELTVLAQFHLALEIVLADLLLVDLVRVLVEAYS